MRATCVCVCVATTSTFVAALELNSYFTSFVFDQTGGDERHTHTQSRKSVFIDDHIWKDTRGDDDHPFLVLNSISQ